jgi:hypothetical protein
MRALVTCCLLGAGCVQEYDVDVYATLPAIPLACETTGASHLALVVHPVDEAEFTLEADGCSDQLAGQSGVSGIYLQIPRLTAGYHRLDATITDADGQPIGAISQPFSAAKQQTIVAFARPDLPGWPTSTIAVAVAGCAAGGPVAVVDLSATLSTETVPAAHARVSCPASGPATMTVPRGPVTVDAVGTDGQGKSCWSGTAQADVLADTPIATSLARSCP